MDSSSRSDFLESPLSRCVANTEVSWRCWRMQPGRGRSSSQASRAVEPTGEASNPDRELAGEKKSSQEAAGGVFRSRVDPYSTSSNAASVTNSVPFEGGPYCR